MNKPNSRQAVPQVRKRKANDIGQEVVTEPLADDAEGNEVIEKTDEGKSRTHERTVTGKKQIISDLYKLSTAVVIKYEGWEKEHVEHPDTHANKFTHWEHTHPFRTFDKKGSKVNTSVPIGGHFHVVEWEYPKNKTTGKEDRTKVPIIKSVSGPMVMGSKLIKGKKQLVPVPANEYDEHTHDVEYLRSSEVEFSSTNIEAQRVIAFESIKGGPIAGVSERDGSGSSN